MNRQQRITHAWLWPMLGIAIVLGLLLALSARRASHVEPHQTNHASSSTTATPTGSAP